MMLDAIFFFCGLGTGSMLIYILSRRFDVPHDGDHLVVISLGGRARIKGRVSEFSQRGLITGDADIGDGRFIQLGIEVTEVRS